MKNTILQLPQRAFTGLLAALIVTLLGACGDKATTTQVVSPADRKSVV